MRITRESLLRLARNTVIQRTRLNRRLVCVYLTGSLLSEEPLLGGVTDIDLVFVHDSEPPYPRAVERVTDEVHLDIAHYSQGQFQQPRHLRSDPWLGSFLCNNPLVLHDIQHWFEFTQAGVCAQFGLPEYILERARPQAEQARQWWFELHSGSQEPGPHKLSIYLKALELAANAIATLSGPPLTDRRFLLHFPERTERIGHPGLAGGLVDLFTSPVFNDEHWPAWRTAWNQALSQVSDLPDCPPRLHSCRQAYYDRAANALFADQPAAALWIVLRTWSQALSLLPAEESDPAAPTSAAWQEFTRALQLDEEHFLQRINALDAYLDHIEETLDTWAKENGV